MNSKRKKTTTSPSSDQPGKIKKIAIVGAGPIGIELAVELKRLGVPYLHFEAHSLASTILRYPSRTQFFSSPERLSIAGEAFQTPDQGKPLREDYLRYLRSVALTHQLDISFDSKVLGPVLNTSSGNAVRFLVQSTTYKNKEPQEYAAENLILATGNMDWSRKLNVPGEDLNYVSHSLGDVEQYFGKKILIIGSGNSAVEATLRLFRIGAHVTLAHRTSQLDASRIKYWLLPELEHLAKRKHIRIMPATKVEKFTPDSVCLLSESGQFKEGYDRVVCLVGYEQDSSLFKSFGLKLEGSECRPVLKKSTMESSVPGVFVIGTACAGTKLGRTLEFIETSHDHVRKVIANLCGEHLEVWKADKHFLES